LKKKSFFCRFDVDVLKEFIPKMKVKIYEANSLIFCEDEVCIITGGMVIIQNFHNKFRSGKMMAKYTEGDIMGFAEIDNGMSNHKDSWCMTHSEVEIFWL